MKKILLVAMMVTAVGTASFAAPSHHHGNHKADEAQEIIGTVLEVVNSIVG